MLLTVRLPVAGKTVKDGSPPVVPKPVTLGATGVSGAETEYEMGFAA